MSEEQRTIYFLGDSILRRMLEYIYSQENRLDVKYNQGPKKAIQLAIGGQTIDQLTKKIIYSQHDSVDYVLNDTVVLLIGTNDFLRKGTFHKTKAALKRLLKTLKGNKVKKIYLLTLPNIFKEQSNIRKEDIKTLNNYIRNLNGKKGITIIDVGDDITQDHMESDGVHPSQRGLRVIRRAIMNEVGEEFFERALSL